MRGCAFCLMARWAGLPMSFAALWGARLSCHPRPTRRPPRAAGEKPKDPRFEICPSIKMLSWNEGGPGSAHGMLGPKPCRGARQTPASLGPVGGCGSAEPCRYLVDVQGQHVSAGLGLRGFLRLSLHLLPVRSQIGQVEVIVNELEPAQERDDGQKPRRHSRATGFKCSWFLPKLNGIRRVPVTESQNSRGWKGPLWVI